jgi:hypothetical protein
LVEQEDVRGRNPHFIQTKHPVDEMFVWIPPGDPARARTKVREQKKGSMFEGIRNTVAMPSPALKDQFPGHEVAFPSSRQHAAIGSIRCAPIRVRP